MSINYYKTLYTNGCSWTAGCELEEDMKFKIFYSSLKNPTYTTDYYDQFTWVGKIAELMSIKNITNQALGGGSNYRIVRTTVEYFKNLPKEELKNHFVIIGWTLPERNELYLDDNEGYAGYVRFNATQKFSFTLEHREKFNKTFIDEMDNFQKKYVSLIHSQHMALQQYFQQVYLLSNLLENLNVKYFFFNALPVLWPHEKLPIDFEQDSNWQNQKISIMPYKNNMYNFIISNNYELNNTKHPLVDGHYAWGQYLYGEIIKREIL